MSGWRTGRWLIGAASVAAVGAVVFWRVSLAERAAEAYLAAHGFPEASLAVSRIGPRRTVIHDLVLGPGLPVVERIEARYSPSDILDLRVREMDVDGLRVTLDDRWPAMWARLEGLLPSGGESGGGSDTPGPKVEMTDSRFMLRHTGAADVTVTFDGVLDLSADPARAVFEATADGEFGRASLSARTEDVFGLATVEVSGHASADLGLLPWPASLGAPPRGGGLEVAFSGSVPVPSLGGSGLLGVMDREGSLAVDLQVREAALPPYASAIDVAASVRVRTGGGVLSARLAERAEVAVRGLPATLPRIAEKVDIGLRMAPPAGGDGPLRGTVEVAGRLAKDRLEATVAAEAAWAPAAIADLPARLTVDLDLGGVKIAADLVRKATWRAEGILASGSSSLAGPFDALFDIGQAGDVAISGELGIDGAPADPGAATPIAGQLRLHGGTIRISRHGIRAEGVEATIPFPPKPGGEVATLSATVSPASGLLAPLVLDARVVRADNGFSAIGWVSSPDRTLRIPLEAHYQGGRPRGRVTFGPAVLEFRPDALQPKALAPALAMVTQAEGALEMSGALDFASNGPVEGEAGLAFRGLSLATAEGIIEDLNGAIRLDGLFPPWTAGEQVLKARRLVVGIPLEEPSLRFRLESQDTGVILVIERAEGRVAGGVVHVDGARFQPAAATHALEIGIDDLSLDRLLRDYAMEGMSGTGTLSGVVPLVFSAAGLSIESGIVEAAGGGVLRVAWGAARDALMGQGEPVSLMVRTLEDFHYSTLRAVIDRPTDGSLSLRVALEGNNPAVKDGHPFRFNISLSGDLEEILEAVREGNRLGASLFDGSLGGAP